LCIDNLTIFSITPSSFFSLLLVIPGTHFEQWWSVIIGHHTTNRYCFLFFSLSLPLMVFLSLFVFLCLCVVVAVVGGFCWFWETEANCREVGLKYVVSVGPAYSSSGQGWSCASGLTWGAMSLITVLTLLMMILKVVQTMKVSLCKSDFVVILNLCAFVSEFWGSELLLFCWFDQNCESWALGSIGWESKLWSDLKRLWIGVVSGCFRLYLIIFCLFCCWSVTLCLVWYLERGRQSQFADNRCNEDEASSESTGDFLCMGWSYIPSVNCKVFFIFTNTHSRLA